MQQTTKTKHKRISVFVSHLGCPHDCAYCNQEKITGQKKSHYRSIDQIRNEIETQLSTICCEQNHVEIAFFGGSFTGLPQKYRQELLELAKQYTERYGLQGIRFSTRPDYITKEILESLQPYPIVAIELGVQSLDPNVLSMSKRGHTLDDVYHAAKLLKESTYQWGIQVMTGLPGDTRNTALETTRKVIELAPNFVRIYPTLVLENTELAAWYRQGTYRPWSLEETIDRVAEMLEMFYQSGIPVIRLGLQQSEELNTDDAVLAGPHHPNIRQLIETQYFRNMLDTIGAERESSAPGKQHVCIVIHPADETAVRGVNNQNIRYFTERYGLSLVLEKDLHQLQKMIQYKFEPN